VKKRGGVWREGWRERCSAVGVYRTWQVKHSMLLLAQPDRLDVVMKVGAHHKQG